MPKQLLTFKQSKYIPGRGGVCFSICALWTRAMLESQKDGWGAPVFSAEDRAGVFAPSRIKKDIAETQSVFAAKQDRIRHNAAAFETAILVTKALNLNGYRPEGTSIIQAIAPAITAQDQGVFDNLKGTIEHFGVRVTRIAEAAWAEIPNRIEKFQTAVLTFDTGGASGHAIAIYRTTGIFSTDYYLFDPNFGEFLCEGESDLEDLLRRIKAIAEYANPTAVRIYYTSLPG